MRIKHRLLCGAVLSVTVFGADAATTTARPQPISQYGLIQNVQNYSSNPFWGINGSYNQGMPIMVDVRGPDLTSQECLDTVSMLVKWFCDANARCAGMQLTDVRPTVMVQLSQLPGHNYASACAGYIDAAFRQYTETGSVAAPIGPVAFPDATTPNLDIGTPEYQIKNPFQKQPASPEKPSSWQSEQSARARELRELQEINGSFDVEITKVDFPTTYGDLSRDTRLANETAGYMPYKDKSPYQQLNIAEMTETERFCKNARKLLPRYKSDLATARQCQADGTDYRDCLAKLLELY